VILPCSCKHKFQDEEYGEGMRVHNYAPKGYNGGPGWRCTVCEKVKPAKAKKDAS